MRPLFTNFPDQPALSFDVRDGVGKLVSARLAHLFAAVAFENKIAVLTIYHCFAPNICTAVFGT